MPFHHLRFRFPWDRTVSLKRSGRNPPLTLSHRLKQTLWMSDPLHASCASTFLLGPNPPDHEQLSYSCSCARGWVVFQRRALSPPPTAQSPTGPQPHLPDPLFERSHCTLSTAIRGWMIWCSGHTLHAILIQEMLEHCTSETWPWVPWAAKMLVSVSTVLVDVMGSFWLRFSPLWASISYNEEHLCTGPVLAHKSPYAVASLAGWVTLGGLVGLTCMMWTWPRRRGQASPGMATKPMLPTLHPCLATTHSCRPASSTLRPQDLL